MVVVVVIVVVVVLLLLATKLERLGFLEGRKFAVRFD
jgi:hypothetical protein